MKLTISSEWEHVPEWRNNRKDENPIKFVHRYLTGPERDRCMRMEILSGKKDSDVRIIPDKEQFFRLSVKEIQNLEVNGQKIATARDFLKTPGLSDLYDEEVNEIISHNQEDDLKNLP